LDYVVGADESSGGVGFGAGVAGAGALEYLWGEVVFEGVDGGLEHADIGVDATHVEVRSTRVHSSAQQEAGRHAMGNPR
jgi:hypothetical protein